MRLIDADELKKLAKKLLSDGHIIRSYTIIGHKADEYLSSCSKVYNVSIVKYNNQLFSITRVNNNTVSIYDLLAEKEVTAL